MDDSFRCSSSGPTPKIGLGCVTFGREVDESTSFAMLEHAVAHGIRFFDTAAAYGNGASEAILGRWLSLHQAERAEFTIATKLLPPYTAAGIESGVRESAARLQLETIDMLFLHQWHATASQPEVLAALASLVSSGQVRALGASNFFSGLLGGIALATAFGWFLHWQYGLAVRLTLATPFLALLAQGGDLFESWLKRRAGKKDSGALFPGHGGALDGDARPVPRLLSLALGGTHRRATLAPDALAAGSTRRRPLHWPGTGEVRATEIEVMVTGCVGRPSRLASESMVRSTSSPESMKPNAVMPGSMPAASSNVATSSWPRSPCVPAGPPATARRDGQCTPRTESSNAPRSVMPASARGWLDFSENDTDHTNRRRIASRVS